MTPGSPRANRIFALALLAAIAGLTASCASRPPHQVAEVFIVRNPVVTYDYVTYHELLQAHQDAHDYCATLNAVPVAGFPVIGPEGGQFITFECARAAPHSPNALSFPIP
jgi:hypothetical protein